MIRTVKRILKIGLKIVAWLLAVLVIAAFVCLDTVDHRPYFREPYYNATKSRLDAQIQTNRLATGDLVAGFGSARLTPTWNAAQDDPEKGQFRSIPLAGYGNRHGKPAQGVHDDVYIKTIALKVGDRVAVMVGADALIIPPEIAARAAGRLESECGLKREQLYLGATHTHSSLGGWGEGLVAEAFAGGFQPGVRIWFSDCIVAAVKSALADIKPAGYGHGRFNSPELIRNRLVGSLGNVDPEFDYAVVRQEGGRVAVLGVFGAHSTVLPSGLMEFSGDYPGFWQRTVEQSTGGMAMFLAGGVGSHSPVSGGNGFEGAEKMGKALGQSVLDRLAATPMTNRVTLGMIGLDVTLPSLNVRLSDGLRLRPWLAGKLIHASGVTFMQVLRLNDSVWISTPCDFSGELALGIKDFVGSKGASAAVTSFNGDYVGYVVPSRYYHMDGYEPRLMSFFGPKVPDYFDELARSMALKLITN
jgi:hypothetical protein